MLVSLFGNLRTLDWASPSMDRYSQELFNGLTRKGIESTLFEPAPPFYASLLPSKVKFSYLRYDFYPKFARSKATDINHITDHSYAQLAKFLPPKKTVVTCHDLIPLHYEKDDFALSKFKESVKYLSQVGLVIADSQATKKDLVESLDIDPNKIKVIYLGVGDVFKKLGEDVTSKFVTKYNLPQKPKILHVGNNLAYKNLGGLLKALKILEDKGIDFVFVKVGPDIKREKIQLGADKYVHIDSIEEELLPALYNSVDVLASPSLVEGFGFPTLEAMACGTSVVVSKGTSLEEIAGFCGIYVEPASPDSIAEGLLKALSLSKSDRLDYGDAAIKRASGFSWEKTLLGVIEAYQELAHD